MAAMRRFYEDVLSFPLERELSEHWIEYRIGGNILALARQGRIAADEPAPKARSITSYSSGNTDFISRRGAVHGATVCLPRFCLPA